MVRNKRKYPLAPEAEASAEGLNEKKKLAAIQLIRKNRLKRCESDYRKKKMALEKSRQDLKDAEEVLNEEKGQVAQKKNY